MSNFIHPSEEDTNRLTSLSNVLEKNSSTCAGVNELEVLVHDGGNGINEGGDCGLNVLERSSDVVDGGGDCGHNVL